MSEIQKISDQNGLQSQINAAHRSLLVVYVLSFMGDLLRGIAAFAPPLLAADLGFSDGEIGLVAASYGMTYWIVPTIAGKISDKIGRKKSILIAYIFYTITSLVYFFANNLEILILAGALEGISLAFHWPAISSVIVELAPPNQKEHITSIYMGTWNLGSIAGPLIAGLIYSLGGYQPTIFIATCSCIFCIISLSIFMKTERYPTSDGIEPIKREEASLPLDVKTVAKIEAHPALPKNKKIAFYLFGYALVLMSSFYLAVLSSYYAGFAQKYTALDPFLISLVVFSVPIGRGIAFALMSFINDSYKVHLAPVFALLASVLLLIIPLVINVPFLVFIFIMAGFMSGFAFSGGFSVITNLSAEKHGLFTGVIETMVGVSFFISPVVSFLVFGSDNRFSPFWFGSMILFVLFVLFALILFYIRYHK